MNALSIYKREHEQGLYGTNLKAGLWMDGSFEWYQENGDVPEGCGEIRCFSQSYIKNGITFLKFTINNRSKSRIRPKIVCGYENVKERQAVAFYSPQEQGIIHVGQQSIAVLGGMLNGNPIAQYCIQGKGRLYEKGCFKSLKDGILLYSPLARGEVTSIFSLETEVRPQECIEASAWVIHTATREEAKHIHSGLLQEAGNCFAI